jgi:WD40 repeat protein
LVRSDAWGFTGDDEANTIAEKPDGRLIIVGSRDVGVNKQIWIINATSIITATEQTTIGGTGNDVGEMVWVLPDGYLITGTYTNAGRQNTYLAKLQLNIFSPPTFEKFYGGNNSSTGKSLVVTTENEIVIVGSITITGSDYLYFVKTDAGGDNPIYQTYGGTGSQRGEAVSSTSDGGFIITGSNGFDGNTMITLVKTDMNGDLK